MTRPAGKPENPRYAPRPRWVKILGVIALLALLATIVVLILRGPHGPGMHGGLGGDTSWTSAEPATVRW